MPVSTVVILSLKLKEQQCKILLILMGLCLCLGNPVFREYQSFTRDSSVQKPALWTWPFPPAAAISHRAPLWEGSAQGLGCYHPSNDKLIEGTKQKVFGKVLWSHKSSRLKS